MIDLPESLAAATEDQPAARLALAAGAREPLPRLPVHRARPAPGRARRRGRSSPSCLRPARPTRLGPAPGARRPLAAPRPRVASPARRAAPGRRSPRARDRGGSVPPVRGRAARLRDRRGRRDGRGEPERLAEDARGAGRFRAPDPDLVAAVGSARTRSAPAARRSRSRRSVPRRSTSAPRGRPRSGRTRASSAPPRGLPAAISSGRSCCSPSAGASCARARRRLPGRRARAAGRGAVAGAAGCGGGARRRGGRGGEGRGSTRSPTRRRTRPTSGPSSGFARRRREAGKRASRRGRTEALDTGLALVGAWLRDLAAIGDGAPEPGAGRRSRARAPARTLRGSTLDARAGGRSS